jgi:Ca2+-binding RTX toxin-like protein
MTLYTSALKPFAFNTTDIEFILAQINFKPLFDAAGNAIINWDGTGVIYDFRHNLLWNGIDALPGNANPLNYFGTSYQNGTDLSGLRDPSGMNNNLALVNSAYGAVDQLFVRSAPSDYTNYVDILHGGTSPSDGAYAALFNYWGKYSDGSVADGTLTGAFNANGILNTKIDYTISAGGTQTASNGDAITITNIVDYTPRMISLLTTTAGVVYDTWANHAGDPNPDGHQANEIYYDTNGVATVVDWGDLKTVAAGGLGQVDTQARFADSAGVGEQFIGGLNPGVSPSNGFFVLFGQFFDHGLDFIDKGGQGKTIKITFSESDPLYGMNGPDGQPVHEITMARATVQSITHELVADVNGVAPGGTGYVTTYHDTPNYIDHTSPFIDQSQTYGSHEQLTTLLREWVADPSNGGSFHAGMKMLDGETLSTQWKNANGVMVNDTLPTLNELRAHVVESGRAALIWEDVLNLRNRDMSDGHLTGGDSGSALILDMNPRFDETNLHDGNVTQDTALDAAITTLHNYVDSTGYQSTRPGDSFAWVGAPGSRVLTYTVGSVALPAGPTSFAPGTVLTGANAMSVFVNFGNMSIFAPAGAEHDAVGTLLLASVGDHYIAGDGRVNENFGLTSIHHVFHEEHNFQVGNFQDALHREAISTGSFNNLHSFQIDTNGGITNSDGDYVNSNGDVTWNLDSMFNAAKLVVEMEYQHAAVDQYARNVTPNIQEFVGYSPDKDPSITLEYAQAAFRFGHSTLRETIDTIDPAGGLTGKIMGYALRDAFLNPDKYMDLGPASIIMGMTHQQMNEVDEFVTPALNQGLLGQPLDLAAINIARGRDLGIPTLNDFREAIGLARYSSWTDFGNNMQHPSSLVNFIAAYSFDGDTAKAAAIMALVDGDGTGYIGQAAGLALAATLGMAHVSAADLQAATVSAFNFLEGDDQGFNQIDTWLGGLAEIHQPGGLLGETFDLVFLTQIESLMDGDRFYYLFRLAGQQFAEEVGGGQLKDIVERNTGLTHLNGNIFGYADKYIDLGTKREVFVVSSAGNTETQTTSNNHKYGDVVDQNGMYLVTDSNDPRLAGPHPTAVLLLPGDPAIAELSKFGAVDGVGALNQVGHENMGIYTNSGRSSARDGTVVTIGGVQYLRDTRLEDTGQDTGAALLNDGLNLDGTPNSGAESNEIIVGTDRNDLIYANGGDDTVYGEDGNDIIYGGYGIDRLYGGDGSDRLYGGDNPDLMDGGSGDDFLYGESSGSDINGADQLIGGSGNDFVSGGVGIDKLSGGTGDDHVVGDGDTDPFTHGSDGNDLVEGNSGGDILYGDNGDDVLVGGADQDQMFGGNGDDIIKPGDLTGALTIGTDEVLGGDGVIDVDGSGKQGFDIIDFSDNAVRVGGVKFDLSNQTNPGVTVNGTPDQVQAFQMEGVVGSAGNDTLTGGSTNAAGDVDNDWIIGGSGNDILAGGAGNDVIVGGSIRLDALIGKYSRDAGTANYYNYNNNNNGSTDELQLQDARYQGASHRVDYLEDIDSSGLLDAANGQLDGVNYAKHFTEMLRSDQLKDTVLGDGGTDGTADTVVFSGDLADYAVQIVTDNGTSTGNVIAYRITDSVADRDGSDLVVGVENFNFNGQIFTTANLVNRSPTGSITITSATPNITNSSATLTAINTLGVDPDGPVSNVVAYQWQQSVNNGSTWTNIAGATGSTLANQTNRTVRVVSTYTDAFGAEVVSSAEGAVIGSADIGNTLTSTSLNDFILGLTGSDTAVFSAALASENFALNASNQLVITGADGADTLSSIENVRFGGAAGALYGLKVGTNGDDGLTVLNGNAGQDLLIGFNGNDIYRVNHLGDIVMELSAAGGTDLVQSQISYTLGTNVENLTLLNPSSGSNDINGTGNALDNVIIGTNTRSGGIGGNNVLTGGGGNDTINGGSGTDTAVFSGNIADYSFSGSGSNLIVTDSVALRDGQDSLTSIESLKFADVTYTARIGTAADNTFGAGISPELFFGLGGVDTVTYSGSTAINANLATGTATNGDRYYSIENLNGSTGVDILTGDNNANILSGRDGNDTLNGGGGNDTLNGGTGNDTFIQLSTDGHDVINGGTGNDTYVLQGTAALETFNIYSRTAWIALGAGHTAAASTGIVVTRNGTTDAAVVAELSLIEEIQVNSSTQAGALSNGNGYTGATSGDTVNVIGNFVGTGLAYSTITVNGAGSTVDITGLTSDHRVVLNADGGTGSIIGDLRPQDVINNAAATPAATGVEFISDLLTGLDLSHTTQPVIQPDVAAPAAPADFIYASWYAGSSFFVPFVYDHLPTDPHSDLGAGAINYNSNFLLH